MDLRRFITDYRWPMFVVGILSMSIIAQGVLVFVATRPDAPRPIDSFYERSLQWDADAATLAASRALGWSVQYEVPSGDHFRSMTVRPVDISITDRDGKPVSGLVGRLLAMRPADTRHNGESPLAEIPHEPGHYRTLARLGRPGIWQLSVDAMLLDVPFVHTARLNIDSNESGGSTP